MSMFDKILVPTDGSELSAKAVEAAIQFCLRTGAQMLLLVVRPHTPIAHPVGFSNELYDTPMTEDGVITPDEVRSRLQSQAEQALQRMVERVRAAGAKCEGVVVAGDQPYKAIIEVAEQQGVGMVMMASHGRSGLQALLLGSETQKVLTHSKVPVLVFR